MWLDRFSGNSTPSGSPPRHGRPYSPGPLRRSSHLAPTPLPLRPGYSPRSSSLSIGHTPSTSTSSLPAAARILNGSALRQTLSPPLDVRDPVDVLQDVISLLSETARSQRLSVKEGMESKRPPQVDPAIDFGEMSLQAFAEALQEKNNDLQVIGQNHCVQTVENCP